jgi:hypothetical protein
VRKPIIACAFACAAVIAVSTSSASAAQPTAPGCVGASVSANAQALHPYGGFISSNTPRNAFGTLADAVHALQAGQIPDDLYANTCN